MVGVTKRLKVRVIVAGRTERAFAVQMVSVGRKLPAAVDLAQRVSGEEACAGASPTMAVTSRRSAAPLSLESFASVSDMGSAAFAVAAW